jgi:hypothetical protein
MTLAILEMLKIGETGFTKPEWKSELRAVTALAAPPVLGDCAG